MGSEVGSSDSEPLVDRSHSSVNLHCPTHSRCSINGSKGCQIRGPNLDLVLLLISGQPGVYSVTSLAFFLTSLIRPICPRQAVLPGCSLIHNPAGERLSNIQESQFDQCAHKTMPLHSLNARKSCRQLTYMRPAGCQSHTLLLGPQERRKSWLALLCKLQCSRGRKIQSFIHSTNTD